MKGDRKVNPDQMRDKAMKLYDKAEKRRSQLTGYEQRIERENDPATIDQLQAAWDSIKNEADGYVRKADQLQKDADYQEYVDAN